MKKLPVNLGKIKNSKFQQVCINIRFTKRGWMWILLPSYFSLSFYLQLVHLFGLPVQRPIDIQDAWLRLNVNNSSFFTRDSETHSRWLKFELQWQKKTEGKIVIFFQHFHHNKNNFMPLWLLKSIANSVFGWENDIPRVCSNKSALFWSSTEELSRYFLNAARNPNCSSFPKQTSA